jgi:hypothetical protein
MGKRITELARIREALEDALNKNMQGFPSVHDFVDPWDFPKGSRNFTGVL